MLCYNCGVGIIVVVYFVSCTMKCQLAVAGVKDLIKHINIGKSVHLQ